MMRRWAVQFWVGSSRAILEVSAETYEEALKEAKMSARQLQERLQEWRYRPASGPYHLYETANGAAVYQDWGADGYQGQTFGDERKEVL